MVEEGRELDKICPFMSDVETYSWCTTDCGIYDKDKLCCSFHSNARK